MSKIDFQSFMHRKKISQAKLAKMLNVTSATVNMYCKGKSGMGFDKIEKLIEMGITPEELFGENAGKKLRENILNNEPTPEASVELASVVRRLEAKVDSLEAKVDFQRASRPASQAPEAKLAMGAG